MEREAPWQQNLRGKSTRLHKRRGVDETESVIAQASVYNKPILPFIGLIVFSIPGPSPIFSFETLVSISFYFC